ncbi:MAG: HAMP domain-containing histidine kinase [Clostridia bacterium]|nr:HAMP domain-containing histidine kinase [Clostridia bacterium]
MINKLKRKFVVLATVFMLVLMSALLLIMNSINYYAIISESDAILDMLTQTNMMFFNDRGNNFDEDFDDDFDDDRALPGKRGNFDGFVPRGMSPEVPYESRFFVVTVSADGEILQSDFSRIISVDDETAKDYISRALESSQSRGFIDEFRFSKTTDGGETRVLFLDCGRKLDSFRAFLWTSVAVGLLGCVIVFIAFMLTAGRIVAPIAESYEKQKRFISDAGHEIKTPLTIINANVDLLELDGEKEELTDIRQQTERLTELTNNLVLLSKMEESEHTLQKVEIPLSDLVSETAGAFRAPAAARHIDAALQIAPDLTINGSPDAIRQLVSILLDNAIKYTPEGGSLSVELTTHRKAAVLLVVNTTQEPVNEKDLQHVFDRFYRIDASRNSQTGGHGIGLSIAKAIVDAHAGSITATTSDGSDFRVTVTLPLQ